MLIMEINLVPKDQLLRIYDDLVDFEEYLAKEIEDINKLSAKHDIRPTNTNYNFNILKYIKSKII